MQEDSENEDWDFLGSALEPTVEIFVQPGPLIGDCTYSSQSVKENLVTENIEKMGQINTKDEVGRFQELQFEVDIQSPPQIDSVGMPASSQEDPLEEEVEIIWMSKAIGNGNRNSEHNAAADQRQESIEYKMGQGSTNEGIRCRNFASLRAHEVNLHELESDTPTFAGRDRTGSIQSSQDKIDILSSTIHGGNTGLSGPVVAQVTQGFEMMHRQGGSFIHRNWNYPGYQGSMSHNVHSSTQPVMPTLSPSFQLNRRETLPLQCQYCPYSTINYVDILTHHEDHHEDNKPRGTVSQVINQCHLCPFSSGSKGALSNHLKQHGKRRGFGCPHCSYSCLQKARCLKHMQLHG